MKRVAVLEAELAKQTERNVEYAAMLDQAKQQLAALKAKKGTGSNKTRSAIDALTKAIEDQMKHGKTTLIEAMINQELGEPFRRDAMKKPVRVAGISKDDMRPQNVA